jgi:small GTP-binding protein
MDSLKVVVVGDGAVGKTCLLLTYTTGHCPGEYVPTIFDNFSANVVVDEKFNNLTLWDTAGQEDYDRLRPLSYPGTDVFVACYSTTSQASLRNLEHKWLPEIREFAGAKAAIVVVGTKVDARSDPKALEILRNWGQAPVTTAQGTELANSVGASAFVECSSFTTEGLKETIDAAVRAARAHRKMLQKPKRKSRLSQISDFFRRKVFGGVPA